jgi:hypothetical protein
MEVSGQIYDISALTQRIEPAVPIGGEVGWATEPVWTLWKRDISLAPDRNRTPAVLPVASEGHILHIEETRLNSV